MFRVFVWFGDAPAVAFGGGPRRRCVGICVLAVVLISVTVCFALVVLTVVVLAVVAANLLGGSGDLVSRP